MHFGIIIYLYEYVYSQYRHINMYVSIIHYYTYYMDAWMDGCIDGQQTNIIVGCCLA